MRGLVTCYVGKSGDETYCPFSKHPWLGCLPITPISRVAVMPQLRVWVGVRDQVYCVIYEPTSALFAISGIINSVIATFFTGGRCFGHLVGNLFVPLLRRFLRLQEATQKRSTGHE